MTDKHITVDHIRWTSVLPCLRLLRAVALSLRPRTVVLALLAVWGLQWGMFAVQQALSPDAKGVGGVLWWAFDKPLPINLKETPIGPAGKATLIWQSWPWMVTTAPAAQLFERNNTWPSVAAAWTLLLFVLLVWAILGGAMVRIIAIRFAREESTSIRSAIRFSSRNWQSYLYGPLLPFLAVGLLTELSHCVGWIHRWWGAVDGGVVSYLGFIPMLCGLGIAILLILMAISWPLMVVAISVEGSDGFDGLSRAFGYLMNRPWYYLFLLTWTLLLGALLYGFVSWFEHFVVYLAQWSAGLNPGSSWGVWRGLGHQIAFAVSVSFFWSSSTVIYFLLRQADDGTPLDQVYISSPPPTPEPLPVVGIAASDQPVIERPAT